MNREELLKKLRRIDENVLFSGVVAEGKKASVVIVGSSALLLRELSSKQITKDVDVYQVEESIREAVLADPDFNLGCQAFCMCLPYNFDLRLSEIHLGLTSMRILIPSLEDLAVMKLYRWEAPDVADLTNPLFIEALDRELLDQLVNDPDEAAASRIADPEQDREFKNLLYNYARYKEGWLQ